VIISIGSKIQNNIEFSEPEIIDVDEETQARMDNYANSWHKKISKADFDIILKVFQRGIFTKTKGINPHMRQGIHLSRNLFF